MALVVAEVAGRRAVASGKMQIDGDRMATADAVIRAGRVIDVIG